MLATAMSNTNPPPAHNVQMHYNGTIHHDISQQQYHSSHYEASTPVTNKVSSPYYHNFYMIFAIARFQYSQRKEIGCNHNSQTMNQKEKSNL